MCLADIVIDVFKTLQPPTDGTGGLRRSFTAKQSNLVPVFRTIADWNVDLGDHQVRWIAFASLYMRSRHGKSIPMRVAAYLATGRGRSNAVRPPSFTLRASQTPGHPQLRAARLTVRLPPEYSIFACMPPTALPSALGVQVGLGVAAGRPLRVKEPHGASERTVSRFTDSNTVVFLGQ
ncbi:hypothetical protein BU25DRAFT_25446 [Macroventuria anomochaeta]|uniref:Uncharacterized protein n=1 Tax=Macroventuria anomochaeta TaxID=301207 RepID=A0ACB6S4W7_9PLEO|nr:uncharacterized protein BU25DRAFT_25446 [Macroventuria anomochaeta]KAF2629012.1 hypothetical protein BU25DRAFT_25446 [Macroventuria anomochaeta]